MKAGKPDKGEALPGAELGTWNLELGTQNSKDSKRTVYDLEERLLEFSARIIRLVDALLEKRSANHIGGQLLRSGTSALPNNGEAQAAESLDDFIHKLKVCLKELVESLRWLKLIHRVPLVDKPAKVEPLLKETDELCRIFRTSIKTCRRRQREMESGKVREDSPFAKKDLDPWLLASWLKERENIESETSKFQVQPPAGPVKYRKEPRKK
jgi:four helix bundle protein